MLTALFAAFLGGIILNFMPCVFPVISLKAFGLIRHDGDLSSARREGIGFLLGVIVTMMVLAGILLAVRAGGAAVGWGFQLQSPLVIALLALVILGAALNLFGVFEVGLSLQRAGAISVGRGAFVRSALTGALAIIVATPCSAPFMASAIGYALVQPAAVALAIFFVLALGFAAPFTLISLFPALAKRLPRPGAWMNTLKHALAFPMLGAYAWLVWVLTQQAGTTALGTLLAGSVVLSFAAWLYGIAQQRQLAGRGYRIMYAVTAALLVTILVQFSGVMKPVEIAETTVSSEPIKWTPQTVEEQRGHGKAIFVNFTASWCITCQVNDKTSLSTQAVKEALARTGTLYMVADSTKFNADVDDALSQFGQGGLPLYVVYPADGGAPKVLPQVLTPSMVVNALNQAAGKKA
ncbi:TPA: protein-disulfide reductase DsbD family protein [Serratia fonticola]